MSEGLIQYLLREWASYPDAPAIVDRGETLTYGALYARIERLGSALIERGLGPERVVGLALEKSADYVVGLFACMYAGAAFVPIDASLPRERRQAYLRRAGAPLALVAAAADDALGVPTLATTVSPAALHAPRPYDPERLAYVIFTSGSTGAPKGVMVTGRGLLPLLQTQSSMFGLAPGGRSLWLLATAFDASISDIGTALIAGATLYIEPSAATATPQVLQATIKRLGITYIDLPPSLLPHLSLPKPKTLRTMVIGGEVGDAATIRRWAEDLDLYVVYGPTEATVCTSIATATTLWDRPLLGMELPEVSYEVVAEDGSGCPPGQAGELLIVGPCVARGYMDEPELTAARFISRGGRRAFRTGDRVVRDSQGLVFLGRIDRQLKVRGALVAPEEIEACLLGHPGVRRAAVAAHGPGAVLTAFLEGQAVARAELRSWLAARLPAYMVPERYVWLPALPVTTSGKPDLAALQELELPRQPLGEAPRPGIEQRLARVFQEVLGVEVGRDDDFFALGGNSLQLIALIAKAAQQGLVLTPAQVAAHPRLEDLATASQAARQDGMATAALRARVAAELAMLDPPGQGPRETAGEDAVLVTGATGFLGSRVVAELLAMTASRVFCLVRADDGASALARLLAAQRAHEGELAGAQARLVPILGDLAQPRLGLDEAAFAALGRRVHTLFHCGAGVSLTADCDSLWSVNVGGTRELLRLAGQGRAKALHYASTLAVFVAADVGEGRFYEADGLEQSARVFGGYAQSKWAAEVLVREAAKGLGAVAVHRLGLLTGDSVSARGAASDWLALTVRGLARLGAVPESYSAELAMDATPIDYAARAMVAIAAGQTGDGLVTTHLAGARVGLAELLRAMAAAGVALAPVPAETWLERLRAQQRDRPCPELDAAYLALRRSCFPENSYRTFDLFQATRCHFDDQQTRTLLQGTGISCPPVHFELLTRYVQRILEREEACHVL